MRGKIYIYSGTGNTQLACEYIAANVPSIDFELIDIVRGETADLAPCDIVGFAAWADYGDPPQRMKKFMTGLPQQNDTPAFVFNTYGAMSGRTLATLDRWARAKGLHVIAGHSLHTPENFPPLIKRGQGFDDSPNDKEMDALTTFISGLDRMARALKAGETVPARRVGIARFFPAFPRTHARRAMGEKHVDEELCTQCGTCQQTCPYDAIHLDPWPVFDRAKCYGCGACYNHCPTNTIHTRKIRSVPQYRRPNDALKGKLDVPAT